MRLGEDSGFVWILKSQCGLEENVFQILCNHQMHLQWREYVVLYRTKTPKLWKTWIAVQSWSQLWRKQMALSGHSNFSKNPWTSSGRQEIRKTTLPTHVMPRNVPVSMAVCFVYQVRKWNLKCSQRQALPNASEFIQCSFRLQTNAAGCKRLY